MNSRSSNDPALLAGDIGGTKTTLGLFPLRSSLSLTNASIHTVQNKHYPNFYRIVEEFLTDSRTTPTIACFGVAGPVRPSEVTLTNLDWTITSRELESRFQLNQVYFINDLVATALGAVALPPRDFHTLNPGLPDPDGAVAVIAPGTGLGQSFLMKGNNGYIAGASEGGHCSFAPINSEQIELLKHMMQQGAPVSVEQVCSGKAIPALYAFLKTRIEEPLQIHQVVASATDKTPAIIRAALDSLNHPSDPCEIAEQTIRLFLDILAAEASNLALKTLSTGGLYIGGGIPPRITSFFKQHPFMEIFSHGRHRELLERIPIHLILNPRTALLGAAAYGLSRRSDHGAP